MVILTILSILFALTAIGLGVFAGIVVKNYARFRYFAANELVMKNIETGTAFDGKYYPATVWLKTKWGQKTENIITDFSAYEDKKIIYFEINTVDPRPQLEDFYSEVHPEMVEKFNHGLDKLHVRENCVVFQPTEGIWLWRPQ
jgi:hypothetical protein